jgi:acid stress chaperone HdeB
MTRPTSISVALAVALVTSPYPGAQAQVALDVTKMTCEQFATYKIANPKLIGIWLNGYHHGARGDTMVDVQQLDTDTKKIQDYCIQNPDVPLMQAVESVHRVTSLAWQRKASWDLTLFGSAAQGSTGRISRLLCQTDVSL